MADKSRAVLAKQLKKSALATPGGEVFELDVTGFNFKDVLFVFERCTLGLTWVNELDCESMDWAAADFKVVAKFMVC